MKPVMLTMQAFASYGKKTTIDFREADQNIFLISGDTGAGKTTIFDAIVFSLYGEASSGSNRKDGIELVSQYVPLSVTPFVELIFEEQEGAEQGLFTIHRVPRHLRPAKRGSSSVEEKETVTLTLPDGSVYNGNQKETDQKIEEIIGLTKGQFMQVAMIAQGEFMELLRADSNKKKEIFRKLFGTGIYQKVVEELGRRQQEKKEQIDAIRIAARQELSHLVIPEEEEQLAALQRKLLAADRLNIFDMEAMLAELSAFCDRAQNALREAGERAEGIHQKRDTARDAFTRAQTLKQVFDEKEAAEKELAEIAAGAAEQEKRLQLAAAIETAYEVQSVYDLFLQAKDLLERTEKNLADQKKQLPELVKSAAEAAKEEERQQKIAADVLALCAQIDPLAAEVIGDEKALNKERKAAEKAANEYRKAREAYEKKAEDYRLKRTAYLDAQAGFLAKELLPGMPCPVCGSTEHPNPAEILAEHADLTREMIDELAETVTDLEKQQRDRSAAAGAAAEGLRGKEEKVKTGRETLRQRAGDLLSLAGGQERSLEKPEEIREYAKEIRAVVEHAKTQAETKSQTARSKKDQAEALIGRYEKELPEQKEAAAGRRQAYDAILAEKNTEESIWKRVVTEHLKKEAAQLQKEAEACQQKETKAKSRLQTAAAAIGDQKKPDVTALSEKRDAAQKEADAADRQVQLLQNTYDADSHVLAALQPKMEERAAVIEEANRIELLYRRLSGKISGSRMDLETYAQRYYLERILVAANARFLEMTAGQFELRMVGEEEAGEGKNRGLDLLVYSAVTGKEREVRTLSGGESFMAALALALGMADQIQANQASVNLDVMFIDEGFGSLDDHARSQAVRVLQQMAGSDRMVGIISHVSELKQEIEDQLIVTRDEEGSHIRWQIS